MQTNCRLLPSMLIILQTVIDAILSITHLLQRVTHVVNNVQCYEVIVKKANNILRHVLARRLLINLFSGAYTLYTGKH